MSTSQAQPSIYLSDVPHAEATSAWHTALAQAGLMGVLPAEMVALHQAHGRVTAQAVWARLSSPHYHASAMDGYAVRSEDTIGASDTQPKQLALGMIARSVDTGDPLPAGANAVVPLEDAQASPTHIAIRSAVPPWNHVRAMGEDVVASELVLPALHRIRPQDLGLLAASGHASVSVLRKPRVAIIPTGTELVPPGADLRPGDIIESNSLMLAALVEACGAVATRWPIQRDDADGIHSAVIEAMREHDLVLVNAGSSRGSEDFTSRVFADVGAVVAHGVAIRPGHPAVLGIGHATHASGAPRALAGIPGYPVSAAVVFDLFCKPVLLAWQGLPTPEPVHMQATLTRKVVSPLGDDEFVRVTLGEVNGRILATPLAGGAGVLSSMVKADGVLTVPRFTEGHHAGETVNIELLCSPGKPLNTILAIGSHDLTLDLLAVALRQHNPRLSLTSAHVGSVSGLLALQRGEAHFAGCHLLDGETGEYNIGAIKAMLAGVAVVLVGFVGRAQGLIVPIGNPKHLNSLADLIRPDVTFVNRQRGAGTRVLLDHHLKRLGIDPRRIAGYARQEYTHLGVAAAVASGACDCGLGILAAARALHLDFVPLCDERYDFVIPRQHYEGQRMQPLLDLVRGEQFPAQVRALGGYETPQMGRVLMET